MSQKHPELGNIRMPFNRYIYNLVPEAHLLFYVKPSHMLVITTQSYNSCFTNIKLNDGKIASEMKDMTDFLFFFFDIYAGPACSLS